MTSEKNVSNTGQSTDWKQYALLAGIGIMLMLSLVQAMQINGLQSRLGTTASLSAPVSSGAETYDQMMARMHPDQVAQSRTSASGPTMVGGC